MDAAFDLLVVADPRFQGGTTAAMVADVTAFDTLGLRVGLVFVRSAYLHDARDPLNPAALALADLKHVTLVSGNTAARAPIAFLHHPMVFSRGIEPCARLFAERSVVVCHHPPFRSDGSLEYDPTAVLRRAKDALGLRPWFAPVSGTVRRQLQAFSPLLRLTSEDWPNVFDTEAWPLGPPVAAGPRLVIGRHGRPVGLKWPGTAEEIAAGLPAGADNEVRVLGCPVADLEAHGADLSRWRILPFGSMTPLDFLHGLDVFVYHYHPAWVEAFGRTVAEASLTGRICLLDPRLRDTFGASFTYCNPGEVRGILGRIRSDPAPWQRHALEAAAQTRLTYSLDSVGRRLDGLRVDAGTVSRRGRQTSAIRTLRKLAGLYRRDRAQSSLSGG